MLRIADRAAGSRSQSASVPKGANSLTAATTQPHSALNIAVNAKILLDALKSNVRKSADRLLSGVMLPRRLLAGAARSPFNHSGNN